MIHPKILIAEDDPHRARMYQTSLEADGFQVLQAADVIKAWQILQAQNLVMAIIDTHLPGLQKHNLLLCARGEPGLANLPVVILGDALESEQVVEWLNQGADDYLSRSISSELLKAQVHAKLRRGKTNAEESHNKSTKWS
jgi:DNA-binding response OmpR family regulator